MPISWRNGYGIPTHRHHIPNIRCASEVLGRRRTLFITAESTHTDRPHNSALNIQCFSQHMIAPPQIRRPVRLEQAVREFPRRRDNVIYVSSSRMPSQTYVNHRQCTDHESNSPKDIPKLSMGHVGTVSTQIEGHPTSLRNSANCTTA